MGTMPKTEGNSRFIDIGGGLQAELISDQVLITYNPTTQHSRSVFTSHPYIKPDKVYLKVGDTNDILDVSLDNYLTMCVVPAEYGLFDPVTGFNLSNLSLAGVVIYIKFIFDFFHNARADQEAATAASSSQGSG